MLALMGAAAFAAAPAALAVGATPKGKTRKVTVNDNYYGPAQAHGPRRRHRRLALDRRRPPTSMTSSSSRRPRASRSSRPTRWRAGDDFKRKLTKAGTYKIICTFHEEEMKMTITVKKQP